MSQKGPSNPRRGVKDDKLCNMLFQAQPMEVELPPSLATPSEDRFETAGRRTTAPPVVPACINSMIRRDASVGDANAAALRAAQGPKANAEEIRAQYESTKKSIFESSRGKKPRNQQHPLANPGVIAFEPPAQPSRKVVVTRRRDLRDDDDYRR
jgi:hypothetical protein